MPILIYKEYFHIKERSCAKKFLETQHLVKKEAFVRTLNYMIQAKQIDFYANDNNYSEVQSACLKLNTLGIRAQAFNTLS